MPIRKNMISNDGELPILKRYELIDIIRQLKNDRDKALVSFLYLTGARVSEICFYILEKTNTRNERITKGNPIQRKQIEQFNGVLTIENVRSLKKKSGSRVRNIPIVIEREMQFLQFFVKYINQIRDPEAYLFPMTRQRAYQILSEVGLYNHYLRHLRLTHLATDYGFSSEELKRFCNWSSSKMADNYVHLNVGDLINKMKSSTGNKDN